MPSDPGLLDGVSRIREPVIDPERIGLFMVVGGVTETSTIPGISIAGPSPEATVWTPTLDLEYLAAGRPLSLDIVPVSPEGLPTPAVITRGLLPLLGTPVLAAASGLKHPLRVPHVTVPSSRPGSRIDEGPALPRGTAEAVFREARILGESLATAGLEAAMIGETIPAGTTTAGAIMEALGGPGVEAVSSSSASNPKELKRRVVEKAVARAAGCRGDVFCVVDEVGDPVHVAIAGIAAGLLDAGAQAVLAGGTQMGAVLAVLRGLGYTGPVMIATTGWIHDDPSSSITGIAEHYNAGLAVSRISFHDAPWRGLRMYDEGYVKEGVGAGGALYLALSRHSPDRVREAVYREYARITGGGGAGVASEG